MKSTMKSLTYSAVLLIAAAAASFSCKREPLHEPFSNYYLQLETDYSAIHIKPSVPSMYEAVFYDKETHKEVGQSYLGTNGGYLYDIAPGTYELLVYSFDSGNTTVSGLRDYTTALATTERYKEGDTLSYNAPDHLLVASDPDFEIPYRVDREEPEILYAYPKTIMDTWCLVIDGIEGLRNAVALDIYVTGQSASNNFGPNVISTTARTIHFPASIDAEGKKIYTPFCTIGKLEDRKSIVRLVIQDPNQQTIICYGDVTSQFLDPENTGHFLYLHFDIKIDPKKDGGMMPVVDPWNDNVYVYDIH